MRLSKAAAVAVFVATLVPLVYMVFFMVIVAATFLSSAQGGPEPTLFGIIFVLHMLCILWVWALLAFYIVYLFKSTTVPKDQRALWAVVLFLANIMAMPVFWWLYIWPESRGSKSSL